MAPRPTSRLVAGLLLLALALAAGAWWQQSARGRQLVDLGGALDEGFVAGFYGRELSDDGRDTSFRWSRPEAELRLRAAPAPAELRLRMLAPAAPDGAATLTITQGGLAAGSFDVAETFRVYSLMLPPGEPRLALAVEAGSVPGDPRALGAVLDRVELRAIGARSPASLAGELVVFPYLPLGLLAVAAAVALAGGRSPLPGAAALGALGLVVLAGRLAPEARLALAWSFTVGAGAVACALAVARLALAVPALRPADDRRAVAWLCGAWALAFALTFAPWVASDGTGYYAYTRSLALDGDLDFANEYREMPFPHAPLNPDQQVVAATGMAFNPFSIGPGLFWLPGFALADAFVRFGPGGYWPADGYGLPYVALTMLTTALSGLVLLLTMYRICRRIAGPGLAALASLAVFVGANPLYYAFREGSFAHGLSAMAAALFVLAWLRLEERPTPRRWAAVGAAGGLSVLLYWTSAIVLLPAALSFGRQLVKALGAHGAARADGLRQLGLGVALALACGLLVVTPQLGAWQTIFGSALTVPQGGAFITPGTPVVGPFFFGALHGMATWTPALFLGMLGLVPLAIRRPWPGLALGLGFVVYLGYNMALMNWHGSGAFGLRRLTLLAPWCALGLAMMFAWLRRVHWSLPVALTALMGTWTTMLAVRYDLYLIDRNVGSLEELPLAAFLLGRDALPVWRLGDWVASGFFGGAIALGRAGAPWPAVLALVALVVAIAAGGLALAIWLLRARRPGPVEAAPLAAAERAP